MSLICIAPDIHCPLFKTVCRKKGNEKWRGKACIAHRTDRPTKFSSWRQAHRRRSSRLWLRRFVVCTASLNVGVGTHPASSMAGAAHLTGGNTQPPKKVGLYDPAFERDACGIGFIADLKRRPTRSTVVVSCSARPTFPLLPLRSPRRGRGCSRTPARRRPGPCTKLLPKALSAPPARAALAATCARTAGPQCVSQAAALTQVWPALRDPSSGCPHHA